MHAIINRKRGYIVILSLHLSGSSSLEACVSSQATLQHPLLCKDGKKIGQSQEKNFLKTVSRKFDGKSGILDTG